jgi:hypothetical protein
MPRVRDGQGMNSRRRPHLDPAYQSHDIICYCATCDEEVEKELPLRLEEFCDCDQYTRWVCLPCKKKEEVEDLQYYRTSTKWEWEVAGPDEDTKWLGDHQHMRAVSIDDPFHNI